LGITFLLLGVLIVMLMYHLMIFINRPNDYSSLSFSAICFFFAVRLLSTGEKLIFEFFPNIDWLLAIRLEYISYKIAPPLVLLFVYHIYPKEVSKFFVKLLFVIAAVFCLIVMITPASVFSHTTSFYLPFILIITIYVLYSLLLAFIRKRPQSFIFFFGFLVFSIIVINDILFYSKIAKTDFLFPFGIFILIFSQASVLSLKSSQAFREAESYKHELEEHNKMLEQKIRKRTAQIEKAKNDLEEQACILQKTNEQLKELSSFKEGMTGMIVHDLKNPLNIILNYAKEEKVLFAARQMLNLVHNLLDLQRNEHSTMITERKTVTIKKLINQALIQVGYLFNEKQIALDNHTHDEVYVNVDQNIMVRVLVNIISNALKFSPVQSTIHISSEIIEDHIILSITDSGPGIPDDKKELIFSMFGQAIKKNLGQSESTGMGLAFCKTAIDAHGGDIGFVSEPAKGTTFWIKLLIERSEKKVIKPKTAEEYRNNNNNEVYILKQSELKRIKKHLKELSKCKVYEITKIKSIMNELEPEASDQLRKWLKMVDQAVWNGSQNEFEKLFDQLKAK
jgi:signal transduction histidine kinase